MKKEITEIWHFIEFYICVTFIDYTSINFFYFMLFSLYLIINFFLVIYNDWKTTYCYVYYIKLKTLKYKEGEEESLSINNELWQIAVDSSDYQDKELIRETFFYYIRSSFIKKTILEDINPNNISFRFLEIINHIRIKYTIVYRHGSIFLGVIFNSRMYILTPIALILLQSFLGEKYYKYFKDSSVDNYNYINTIKLFKFIRIFMKIEFNSRTIEFFKTYFSHILKINTPTYNPMYINYLLFIKFSKNILVSLSWILKLSLKLWKFSLISTVVAILYFLISIFYNNLEFLKQISVWYFFLIIVFLLMIGFVYFLSKYRIGKYTSAIQRFWKKTSIIFWLIEIFLFILFYYYYLNSSQEPSYMFDFYNLNQEFLLQTWTIFQSNILLSFIIILGYLLILNLNYYTIKQNYIILTIITLFIFFILCNESYQFFYIISTFNEKFLELDQTLNLWNLQDIRSNLRVKQQYFTLCLIAKYWHFIFIFVSWFFFIINVISLKKITYTLLGFNIQNFIILYILNLSCLIQFLKFFFKKFIELYYYWFHLNFDDNFIEFFIKEILNIIINLI